MPGFFAGEWYWICIANVMKQFLRNNGLSIVFLLLFIFAMTGQVFTGWKEHNSDRNVEGMPQIGLLTYLRSGHFLQSTFENWESEFLQMALFVILTISLYQKGSSESKALDGKEPVDREPSAQKKDAPWPVKHGGWILVVYKHSLSIALSILFVMSFILHLYGSLKDENEHRLHIGQPAESLTRYLSDNRFWFESFQNWQSEFLSVFAIVVLSIFLRQKGSPQSKPVDAPNSETGE